MTEKKPDDTRETGHHPATPSDVPRCDLCSAIMIERHCKLICPACGYQRDCSDP